MWRQDEVPNWKEKQLKGTKLLYWIVSLMRISWWPDSHFEDQPLEQLISPDSDGWGFDSNTILQLLDDDLKDKEKLLASHVARYPGEATPLQDTAGALWKEPRTPSGATFVPVGHVALERDDGSVLTSLTEPPEEILWVKHLYISWAAQAGGLGRSAMDQVEALATRDPVNAKVMVLDTMKKEFQASDEWKKTFYTDMGLEIPDVSFFPKPVLRRHHVDAQSRKCKALKECRDLARPSESVAFFHVSRLSATSSQEKLTWTFLAHGSPIRRTRSGTSEWATTSSRS